MIQLQTRCVLYFEKNPSTYNSLLDLALIMGVHVKELEQNIDHLVEMAILETKVIAGILSYRYVHPIVLVLTT